MSTESPTRPQPARGAEIGSLIGGVFGLVFLIVNSSGFSTLGRILVIAMGVAAFAVIAFLALKEMRRSAIAASADRSTGSNVSGGNDTGVTTEDTDIEDTDTEDTDTEVKRANPFSRGYWIVVIIEAIALFGGSRFLTSIGHPELGVAWVAFVVGTHFYALGYIFHLARFHLLATVITVCGLAGFVAWFADIPDFIPIFSGIIPGFVLLAFGLWALAPIAVGSNPPGPTGQ